MIYFSSDWHLGHRKIIELSARPFDSVEQMDETIVENMNKVLKKGDDLYFLGDLAWGVEEAKKVFLLINKGVRLHLIEGNHDKNWHHMDIISKFTSIGSIRVIKHNRKLVTMCHYPMLTWDRSHFNSWMLHGHHHTNISDKTQGKIMNVCVDVNNFMPVSINQVEEYMATRPDNWDLIKEEDRR